MDISLAEAICDDLPDGAYWAMMEELTGFEPPELCFSPPPRRKAKPVTHDPRNCSRCGRTFTGERALQQHIRDKHLRGRK